MPLRLFSITAAFSILAASAALAAVPTGGAVAEDEAPAPCGAVAATVPSPSQGGVRAAFSIPLLAIVARPVVAGRTVTTSVDTAGPGCLTLELAPTGSTGPAATPIGGSSHTITRAGRTTVSFTLNRRGAWLLRKRRSLGATLTTDFTSAPAVTGAQVTLGTPLWLGVPLAATRRR